MYGRKQFLYHCVSLFPNSNSTSCYYLRLLDCIKMRNYLLLRTNYILSGSLAVKWHVLRLRITWLGMGINYGCCEQVNECSVSVKVVPFLYQLSLLLVPQERSLSLLVCSVCHIYEVPRPHYTAPVSTNMCTSRKTPHLYDGDVVSETVVIKSLMEKSVRHQAYHRGGF